MELNTALQKLKEYERRGFALSCWSGEKLWNSGPQILSG